MAHQSRLKHRKTRVRRDATISVRDSILLSVFCPQSQWKVQCHNTPKIHRNHPKPYLEKHALLKLLLFGYKILFVRNFRTNQIPRWDIPVHKILKYLRKRDTKCTIHNIQKIKFTLIENCLFTLIPDISFLMSIWSWLSDTLSASLTRNQNQKPPECGRSSVPQYHNNWSTADVSHWSAADVSHWSTADGPRLGDVTLVAFWQHHQHPNMNDNDWWIYDLRVHGSDNAHRQQQAGSVNAVTTSSITSGRR